MFLNCNICDLYCQMHSYYDSFCDPKLSKCFCCDESKTIINDNFTTTTQQTIKKLTQPINL